MAHTLLMMQQDHSFPYSHESQQLQLSKYQVMYSTVDVAVEKYVCVGL